MHRESYPTRTDQARSLLRSGSTRQRSLNFALLLPGVIFGGLAWWLDIRLTQATGLFTATSITTGLTFSMATTFWSRSVDARSDPSVATKQRALATYDANRSNLIWTVAVGLAATSWLAGVSIFANGEHGAPPIITAVSGFFVIYLLTLVGRALYNFSRAAFLAR